MDLSKLKQTFKGEITTEEADREKYSRDASIFHIVPQAVVFPKDVEDIKALVTFVSEEKTNQPDLSLTVRAGGTDMTGGSINDSIIIDVSKHLNRLIEITDTYAVTEPGLFFRDFEPSMLSRNRIMPAYPVSKAWCAVGGMVGNNAGGEKTFSYGQVIDYVEEVEMVLGDGNAYTFGQITESELQKKCAQQNFEGAVYKQLYQIIQDNYRLITTSKPTTSKNSAGYYLWRVWDGTHFNMAKLFVGSQGTLGVITKIKWKLVPVRRKSELLVFFLNDLSKLGKVINAVNELKPESFELFDEYTLKTALKYLPEILRKMKGNRLKLLWKFIPEFWMAIRGGLPKIVLLAEFTGDTDEEVTQAAGQAQTFVQEHFNLQGHIARDFEEAQKYWTIRRESYNLLRQHNARKVSAPFIEDIVVHPDQLPEFMPKLDAILQHYPNFVYTIAGHAGDANFHIMPLMDLSDSKQRDAVIALSDAVFKLVLEFNGSITAEHNDGLVRGPFLEQMFGVKMFYLFRAVKHLFDPHNIFNPHKKTDADLNYFVEHLKHGT